MQDYLSLTVPEVCAFNKHKRSVDSPIVRHKRQGDPVVITFPNVTIDQSIVTMISDTLLPAVVNVSLNSGKYDCGTVYIRMYVHTYMHVHYHNYVNYKILVFYTSNIKLCYSLGVLYVNKFNDF